MKATHIPKPEMNKTETQFSWMLEADKQSGKIKWWGFEKINLKVSSLNCWYKIDFMIVDKDDIVKMIEVKGGYIYEGAVEKFKVVCDLYPFIKFEMWQLKKKEWKLIREN